jgi:hypothetical protein
MEFDYVPFNKIVTGKKTYDWSHLEAMLTGIASRGNQAVFRVYIEYPGRSVAIPDYLIRDGLKTFTYKNPWSSESNAIVTTPDYDDPKLQQAIVDLIQAMGAKYDGDPRIGFLTAGLLGFWGEWHNYPKEEFFAKKTFQARVLDTYEKAFHKTPVLLRYPAGPKDPVQASNVGRKFGYHDDSFAWATLDTGREDQNWFFLSAMKRAGNQAVGAWKRHPIGGEVRPELWQTIHDRNVRNPQAQNFAECVKQTHASWLMDSGAFSPSLTVDQRKGAIRHAQLLGYDLSITQATLTGNSTSFTVKNHGVAPFYYPWPVEVIAEQEDGRVDRRRAGTVQYLLPGSSHVFRVSFSSPKLKAVWVQMPNPLSNGKPVRFANVRSRMRSDGSFRLFP